MNLQDLRRQYQEDGYVITPAPVVSPDLLQRANEHMDAIIAGDYETGVEPRTNAVNATTLTTIRTSKRTVPSTSIGPKSNTTARISRT